MRIWTVLIAAGLLVVVGGIWTFAARSGGRSRAEREPTNPEPSADGTDPRPATSRWRSHVTPAPDHRYEAVGQPQPAPTPPTARSERDLHTERVATSGPAPATFLTATKAIEDEWRGAAREAGTEATLSSWQCFRAGCFLAVRHKNSGDVEQLATRFSDGKGFIAWPGSKFRSGPIEKPTGETEVTWVLFAPEPEAGNELHVATQ